MTTKQIGFWDYVTEKLQAAVQFEAKTPEEEGLTIDSKAARRLESVLREVCDGTMVYPIIEPDDNNEACASWWADIYALQISVDKELGVFVIFGNPGNKIDGQRLDLSDAVLTQRIRKHLHTLSDNVKQANPNWYSVATR